MVYALRRWFTRIFGTLGPRRCCGCNAVLTHEEVRYYRIQCNRCECRDVEEWALWERKS